jgi:CRISPR system Cascade subunit CasE
MYFSRVKVKGNIRELTQFHNVIRGNGYGIHQLLWDLFPGSKKRSFLFREEIVGEQLPRYDGSRGMQIYYIVSQNEPKRPHLFFEIESKIYNPKIETGDRLAFRLRANPTVSRKETGKINSVRHDVVMDAQYCCLRELAQDAGVEAAGKKSDLKERVLVSWLSSKNPVITAKLARMLKANERYRELLDQKLPPAKLFDHAFKAATDNALEKWLTDKGEQKGFKLLRNEKRKQLKFQGEGYRWHALPKKGKTAGFSSIDFSGEIEVTSPDSFTEKALFEGIGPAKAFGCGLMLVRRV